MNVGVLEKISGNMSVGIGSELLSNVLRFASEQLQMEYSALILWKAGQANIISGHGLPFTTRRSYPVDEELAQHFAAQIEAGFLQREFPLLARPASIGFLAHSVASVPIAMNRLEDGLTLTCADPRSHVTVPANAFRLLEGLSQILKSQLRLLAELLAPEQYATAEAGATPHAADDPPIAGCTCESDGEDIVTNFLLRTLPLKRRILTRQDMSYHVLRGWRAPIKEYQVEALRASKASPSDRLADTIAGELVGEAHKIVGSGAFTSVTSVPCGHSGPGCLSWKIGVRAAAILNLPYVEAFEPIPVRGSSHPKTNARRPMMKLRDQITGSTLLVDDVATSGAHIMEACNLLRRSGAAVLPLVWIGA